MQSTRTFAVTNWVFFLSIALLSGLGASVGHADSTELSRVEHRVGPSETLAEIAATYGVKASSIQQWNNLSSLDAPLGTTLVLYIPSDRAVMFEGASEASGNSHQKVTHTVRSGETLSAIAAQYDVKLGDLVLWNGLSNAQLETGQRLSLYVSQELDGAAATYFKRNGVQRGRSAEGSAPNRTAQATANAEVPQAPESSMKMTATDPPTPELPRRPGAGIAQDVVSEIPRRNPPKEIPAAIPNPLPYVQETIVMNTEELHGFTLADLKIAQNQVMGIPQQIESAGLPAGGYPKYLIGPPDVLEFLSFNDPSLNREEVVVRFDGYVSLPLIPDVKVGGKSREDAEEIIQEAYGEVFRDPEISLMVKTPDSKTYTIIGDIQDAGRYAYMQPTTLLDAISMAGGLRERGTSGGGGGGGIIGLTGQVTQAIIIRDVDGRRVATPYDLREFGEPGAFEGDAPVFYGDLIYVPEGVNLVYVLGEMRDPVTIELTKGLTLLRALAMAGGFDTSTARLREVVVIREIDPEHSDIHLMNVREMLKTGQDFELQAGDIVYIPRKHLVRLEEFVRRFTGSISPLLRTYIDAVQARFIYDIQDETLEALENQNVNIGVRSAPVPSSSSTRTPGGIIRPQNLGGSNSGSN